MNKDEILIILLLVYLFAGYYIYRNYNNNSCISQIITSKKYKHHMLLILLLFGIFTLNYENKRNDMYSLIIISIILCCLVGVVSHKETQTIHYLYTLIVCIFILMFMIRICYINSNNFLKMLLLLQIVSGMLIMYSVVKNKRFFFCRNSLCIKFCIVLFVFTLHEIIINRKSIIIVTDVFYYHTVAQ